MHTSPQRTQTAIAIASVIALGSMADIADADILIDDFTEVGAQNPWPVIVTDQDSFWFVETDLVSVMGGTRQSVFTTKVLNPPGPLDQVGIAISDGELQYSASPYTTLDFSIEYWGEQGGDDGFVVDFSGETGFRLNTGMVDATGLVVGILISDGSHTSAGQLVLNDSFSTSYELPFDEFFGIESVDLSHVTAITMSFSPWVNADFAIESLSTYSVPAPGSLALLGVGMLCGRSRRRGVR